MLSDHIDFNRVTTVVEARHAAFVARTHAFGYADPIEIGVLAAKYVADLCVGQFSEDAVRKQAFAWAAGALIYSTERYGMNFDDICQLTDIGVANILASVCGDQRLSESRRGQELRSSIGQADIYSQAVRLAEIYLSALKLRATFGARDMREHDLKLKSWLEFRIYWLESMNKLRGHEKLRRKLLKTYRLVKEFDAEREAIRRAGLKRGSMLAADEHEAVDYGVTIDVDELFHDANLPAMEVSV